MRTRRRIILFFLTCILMIWVTGYFAFSAYVYALRSPDTPEPSDAIVVLTGGAGRINTGLDMLYEKQAEHLFISGVDRRVSIDTLLELWERDIDKPPCCIVLGYEAQNTEGNADETRQWVTKNNIQSVKLVTADYHMPRAKLEFNRRLPQVKIEPHPVASNQVSSHMVKLGLLFHEYNKTLLTLARINLKDGTGQ